MAKTRSEPVPDDIYIGFVRSLFNDAIILGRRRVCHCLIALLSLRAYREPIYLVLAGLMLAAGLYRYYGIRKYQKIDITGNYAAALKAEQYYLVGGTIQGFFLGLFCFVAIYWTPDIYGEIASVSVAMGSTTTIVGRNYGSRAMVAILSVTVVMPIAVGLMLKGDVSHIILGLYIIPFMVIITRMATHVRTVLFTAISEEKKSTSLAQRFDRALNTMSHGLVMLSPNGRVVVANAEAEAALGAKSADALLGRSLKSLVMRGVASGLISGKDGRYLEAQLTRALREGRDRKILVGLVNGRHYEFSTSEGAGGLGVIIFEDVSSAHRCGGEDPLDGAVRQSDRSPQPRLFPRDRQRDDGDAATMTAAARSPCSTSTTSRASTTRSAIRSATA